MGEDKVMDVQLFVDGKCIGCAKSIPVKTTITEAEKIIRINNVLDELAYVEESLENAQLAAWDARGKLFEFLPNDLSRDLLLKYYTDTTEVRNSIQKVVLGLEKQKRELEGEE